MARAIWKGSIAFGLVQIPVALMGAEEPNELSFDLLDRRDFAPVGYERVNKRTGKKVDWKNVVKGYEHSNGKYVVLTDDDFEQANIEATHTIDIDRVVEASEIDPMYFERPYYVAPDKQGQKAYALLRDTLAASGKIAIARVVIRTRQHLAALMPHGDVLVLEILRFAHELRDAGNLELPGNTKKLGITAKEREMAKSLVQGMAGEWDPEEYKDEYRNDLMNLIRQRVKRGELNSVPEKAPKKHAAKRPAEVVDLMSLLQESVAQQSNDGHARRGGAKKKAGVRGVKKAHARGVKKAHARERHLKKSA